LTEKSEKETKNSSLGSKTRSQAKTSFFSQESAENLKIADF
jgi:hypothetical protein